MNRDPRRMIVLVGVVLLGREERMYVRDPRRMNVLVEWMVVVAVVGSAVVQ